MRIEESLVWGYSQLGIALQHLFVENRIDVYGILLHHATCPVEVALALYALYFGKKSGESLTKEFVIIHLEICLAVPLGQRKSRGIVGESPSCHQRTVAHMCLLYFMSGLDARQLSHQTVHKIGVVLRTISIGVRHKT